MSVTRENIDNVNARLTVKIEKADYEESVKAVLKDYRLKANIPGFRPGKVPAGIIQKRFGKAVLVEEVNKALSQDLTKYITEEKLPLLGEPLPNDELQKPIDWDTEDFEFVFDIALAPEISINLTKKNKYKYHVIKVDDEMIDQQVEAITSNFGSNKAVDVVGEKSNVRGNFVQLSEDGNELEDGICPQGVLLAVDLIKEESVKTDFLGKKKEETIVFNPVKAFQNKHEVGHMLNIKHEEAETLESDFKFTITEILDFEKAEVNEDLFKKTYGDDTEITTIEAFREKIKEDIAKNLSHSSDHKFTLDARDTLVEKTEMVLPEAFLKRWLLEKNNELTEDQVEKDFGHFMTDLKWQLIKDSFIKENELNVTPEEALGLARQITFSQFNQYGMYNLPDEQLDQFANMMLEKPEEKERIYGKILEDKVIGIIKEKVTVTEVEVSKDEFNEMVK